MQIIGYVQTARKTINLDEKLCTTEFGRMPWYLFLINFIFYSSNFVYLSENFKYKFIFSEKVKFCIKYTGKLKPEFNTVDIKLKVQVDSKKGIGPRAFVSRKDLVTF